MKIRDHPSLAFWPPEWVTSSGNESLPFDKSEELVLREVELFSPPHKDPHRGYIRLSGEYGRTAGKTYTGLISGKTYTSTRPGKIYTSVVTIVRDPEFRDHLYQKLRSFIGQTIREVGDSEI